MAFVYGNRVRESSTSTGSGDIVLDGPLVGFTSFDIGVGLTNECFYCIVNSFDDSWEVGRGTVGAGTFSRDMVFSSSNSNNLVTLDVGDKVIFTTDPSTHYSTILDQASHALEDHTVSPLNLLDPIAHSAVDHTAAPMEMLSVGSHEVTDHTIAPFNLIDVTSHESIDHTVGPFLLLDSVTHGAEDHTVGPLFLLNQDDHLNITDHSSALNNNPVQVTPPERGAGDETDFRSYSPVDIKEMLITHQGGAPPIGPLQMVMFSWAFSGSIGPQQTGPLAFDAKAAIFLSALAPTSPARATVSMGVASGTGTIIDDQVGIAQLSVVGADPNSEPSCYDVSRVLGVLEYNRDFIVGSDFVSQTGVPNAFYVSEWNHVSKGIEITNVNANAVTGRIFCLVIGQ